MTESQRDQWVAAIKEAIGYANIEDFYHIKSTLGQGKFGKVKLAVHKKTERQVAIKFIRKEQMNIYELEL
eukprot:CAMPEP_0202969700 /NCGR_PEP_ID=MMETSP1396-20130829/15560_1 /ASSEMBLY_ACC=CAM_ASM_000872 /TAXON_ID= /ORGANISM="Pseudokeronopsis sp., Strain Brazil" /LENGTH=69 /DNA_ID=CAMNT_0049697579 /DNA_START=271 /DNA_END=480 /DNA_ORIENTATION=+